ERPGWQMIAAQLAELLLESDHLLAGLCIPSRNRTPRARVRSLELDLADRKGHGVVLMFAEELIFPERRNAINFEWSPKAPPQSPGADKVTELISGANVERIKWMLAVRLPFMQRLSAEYSAHTRSSSRPPPEPIRDRATDTGSSDLIG